MLDPQLIFQSPSNYEDYLLSKNPEGQYFDRKEVRNDSPKSLEKARDGIVECISGFTNSNGGILVLGISDDGEVKGLGHLIENEYNSLVKQKERLSNHHTQTKEFELQNQKLLIFYIPEGLSGVCKTIENRSQGWIREAANNLPLTQHQEESLLLQRNKKWEQLSVCEYSEAILNKGVVEVFKKRYLDEQGADFEYKDEDFIITIGAAKSEARSKVFTNAGFLFFSNNPSSYIPSAQIRFLKYDSESNEYEQAGNPTFDKTFDGCLPELLRKVRSFVNEGAFFKKYVYRNPQQSGIVEEPELPPNAVEEAIVNAIIHRDYNSPLPISCILFKDAFVVRSPGKMLQPNFIPVNFNLDNQRLTHYPRNPKISQWAKTMVDESGQRFVKLLSEGHRSMLKAMKDLGLPSPIYYTNGFTTVKLYNNYLEREQRFKKLLQPLSDEFSNLFEIEIEYNSFSEPDIKNTIQAVILGLVKDKLQNLDWFIDKDKFSRITVHRKGSNFKVKDEIDKRMLIYPSYSLQIHFFEQKYYLSIDYDIQLKNVSTLDQLLRQNKNINLESRNAQIKIGGVWTRGIIEKYTDYTAQVFLSDFEKSEDVLCKNIIPNLTKSELSLIAEIENFNLDSKIKELSLSSIANASKERAKKILDISKFFALEIFPISYNGFTAFLKQNPLSLNPETNDKNIPFTVIKSLKEPEVRFSGSSLDSNILSGLTKYGSYTQNHKDIEIVPFCIKGFEEKMQKLISSLQTGQMNFKGMERTFGTSIKYNSIISRSDANEFENECRRLLSEYPEWENNKNLDRIFLIHIPEDRYYTNDINSPYYSLKQFLLEKGLPVQMIDTPTLNDAKFKDLNLALNIIAKTGGTPWVLPDALPDADCFIGLSYSQYKSNDQLYRTMGYANVFNKYGQWKYYKGNIAAFDFEQKHIYLAQLVKETLQQMEALPDRASIHIHYSNKFSRIDREHILRAAQEIRPNSIINFVWINTHHNIRLFDNRIEGNGSLSRGNYVTFGKHQFYLSTTGYSTLRKTLGTPIMLEINSRVEPYIDIVKISQRTIAQQLLSLTKLNWSSTQSINAEPVTTKYAYNIARLSSIFYRRKGEFKLNKVLESTPWFI